MEDKPHHPIRVVMFGGGPELTRDVQQFLYRLDTHPEIELLGAFCQSESQSWEAIFGDLWERRGVLAFPLFISRVASEVKRYVIRFRGEIELRKAMERLSPRIHNVADIHSQDVLDRVSSLEPDLGLIYGSPILKPKLFEIPRLGTLGIHHGKVPEYRGNKTTFWAMYYGEPAAGVTIQKVNAGLDTGSIVKEGAVAIGNRSYREVWRDLEALGLNLYIQAILEVKNGSATFRAQSGEKGRLYKNPKPADFFKFWVKRTVRRFK
jgi:methionyl-tRNA formyltransferase